MKEIISNWLFKYRIHLLVWTFFILYETIIVGIIFNIYGNPITYFAHYTVTIVCFYLNSNIGLPWALSRKETIWWRLSVELVIYLTTYILLHYLTDLLLIYTNIIKHTGAYRLDFQFILRNLYRAIYFSGFSTGYYFLKTYLKEKSRQEEFKEQHFRDVITQRETENKLEEAKNSFLKAQINPHFLFNTLDFIYHNINYHSNHAAEAIIILSKMMRYAVDSDKTGNSITLDDELEQVENLLQLYQLRKTETLGIQLECAPEVRNMRIIPLVLLTLAENIFKHGDLSKNEQDAFINIYIEKNFFHIETKNLINKIADNSGTQNGLKNIEKRLHYAYGDSVIFCYYTDPQDNFIVNVAIPASNASGHYVLIEPSKDDSKQLSRASADQKRKAG